MDSVLLEQLLEGNLQVTTPAETTARQRSRVRSQQAYRGPTRLSVHALGARKLRRGDLLYFRSLSSPRPLLFFLPVLSSSSSHSLSAPGLDKYMLTYTILPMAPSVLLRDGYQKRR